MCVCLCVRSSAWNILAPTGRIFMKFDIFAFFFRKRMSNIQVSLKPDKNNGWFTWRPLYINDNISLNLSYNEIYGAETWTLRAADQKYLESFEMWCWRRVEKISWTDHVRNGEVWLRVNEQRNMLHEIRKRKANWVDHILHRNCLLKQVIEGKIKGEMEVTRRRGRRRKKLLDDLKDRIGYSHLKKEALDRTMRRNRFGGDFGTVVRQNTEWINECKKLLQ